MLLAVDAGNTQTVLGLIDLEVPLSQWDQSIKASWRVATDPARTSDELGILVRTFLSQWAEPNQGTPPPELEGVVISSTVPSVQGRLVAMSNDWLGVSCITVGAHLDSGMAVLYDNPLEVGPDRIANSVAVLARYGGPAVVVDFGTATTLDAVSGAGEYLGGAIMPGVEISLDALFVHAALLRRVDLGEPRSAIGRSTADAIRSGTLYGFAAQADGLCRRFLDELGPATVVSTGGLAGLVGPYCSSISAHEPMLTLHGLRILFERNRGRSG